MNFRPSRTLWMLLLGSCWAPNISRADPTPINPFTYCAKVGSIDASADVAWQIPVALIPRLRTVLGLAADAPVEADSYRWRCMDGAVYVCALGANIPCNSRADLSVRNRGADNYCRRNREAQSVPAYATGHATLYEWRCFDGKSMHGKALGKIDKRGYRTDFWFRVPGD